MLEGREGVSKGTRDCGLPPFRPSRDIPASPSSRHSSPPSRRTLQAASSLRTPPRSWITNRLQLALIRSVRNRLIGTFSFKQ